VPVHPKKKITMKTVLQKIHNELENELKDMNIDEFYKFSPIFKWMQKLCKLHMIEEEKQILQAFIMGQNCPKGLQNAEEWYKKNYDKNV